MNRKDIELLNEAYMATKPPSVFDRALADPTNFILHIDEMPDLDYEGGSIMVPVYTVYELESDGSYGADESVSAYDDIEDIVDAFEKKNPGGIKDER